MNTNFRFEYQITGECIKGKIKYENDEILFNEYEKNLDRKFSLMFGKGYNDLCISTISNKVVVFNGYNPKKMWKKTNLTIPVSKKGEVYLCNDLGPIMDGQWYIENWQTQYDNKKNTICIGDFIPNNDDIFIEFCTNIIICLNNNLLKAIWIKEIKEKK